MKKLLMPLIAGLVVFGMAAGTSWFVRNRMLAGAAHPPDATGQAPEAGEPASHGGSESKTAHAAAPDGHAPASQGDHDLMPVAVREDSMSVEELLRFSLSLKEREKKLIESEEQARQLEVRQRLVLADIQAEQKTIDGLRTQLTADQATAQGMLAELTQLRDAVISEREKTKQDFGELESRQIDISAQHRVNDKKLSGWLQGMSAENAAAALKEMANDGDMATAVQILANFEEREAAKVLDSINDPKLLNEFILQFRNLKNSKSAANPGTATK